MRRRPATHSLVMTVDGITTIGRVRKAPQPVFVRGRNIVRPGCKLDVAGRAVKSSLDCALGMPRAHPLIRPARTVIEVKRMTFICFPKSAVARTHPGNFHRHGVRIKARPETD